ncbi:hypothetical protein DFH08DRAFT_820105 [Mycena albidolilacea]|uniref:Uncharacterized protein n=1 Tax=Mycena albidolilacea TaxID=1033008 RepID=A0AAD6ZCW4_9AGAR|nr:hypothetical protein DFH08DRAFT_820105 [Mycena albidolilacea]
MASGMKAGGQHPKFGTSEIGDWRLEDVGWRIQLGSQRMEAVRLNWKEAGQLNHKEVRQLNQKKGGWTVEPEDWRAHVTLGWGLCSTETVEQLYTCSGIRRVQSGVFPPSRLSTHTMIFASK